MYIAFAPMQGYTDAVYRRAHYECVGGVEEYYTPFARLDGDAPRAKDLRDTDPERNAGVPTVPQVIARDVNEFARLCDALQEQSWRRIDLNMGCPFPMQVRAGSGSGLLQHPDRVEAICDEMLRRPGVGFSIKMRLGQEGSGECISLLPIINDMPLVHVTLHPRLGQQQYKGEADREAFSHFYEVCKHPIVYNGDISSMEDAEALLQRFPSLKGVMMGRGLLARPWMLSCRQNAGDPQHAQNDAFGRQLIADTPQKVMKEMHAIVYRHDTETLCGDSQILARLHAFWEYLDIDRKAKKAILKATTLPRYREAVASALR